MSENIRVPPPPLGAAVRSKTVVLLLLIRCWLLRVPVVGFCNCFMFCCALLYVLSSFAIILMGKRELVALLCLSPWCLVIVVWLFLTVSWVCLQLVIVVFPDHTLLKFWTGLPASTVYPPPPQKKIWNIRHTPKNI